MSQHIATRWPNDRSMLYPTMLRFVALKYCDRLAGDLLFDLWVEVYKLDELIVSNPRKCFSRSCVTGLLLTKGQELSEKL